MNALIELLKQYAAIPSTEYSGMPHVLVPNKLVSDTAVLLEQVETKYPGEFSGVQLPHFVAPLVEQPAEQPVEQPVNNGEQSNG